MPKYTVRVELHGVPHDSATYAILHRAMQRRGFSRTIETGDGRTYQLPTEEYNYEGNEDGEEVRAAAKEAARETGKAFAVLVTQSLLRWWSGLKE